MKKTKVKLNADQENFCKLFVMPDTEFYGNGVQSYLEAYSKKRSLRGAKPQKPLTYDVAKANAYKLLTNPIIIERINALLESGGFNDENTDKQHLFLLNQFADLKTKLGAIKEYNELKSRINKPGTLDNPLYMGVVMLPQRKNGLETTKETRSSPGKKRG